MADCTCADPQAVANAIEAHTDAFKDKSDAYRKAVNPYSGDNNDSIHATLYGATLTGKASLSGGGAAGMAGAGNGAGKPGAIAPMRFCHWAAPEVSGWVQAAWEVARVALEIAISKKLGDIKDEISEAQKALANDYYNMAESKWKRFTDRFYPLEKILLNTAANTPVRMLDCADARLRATQAVDPAFAHMQEYLSRTVKKLRVCVDSSQVGMLDHKRAIAQVDTENFNMQDDRWFTDYKNDLRWNRRSTLLNLGRNLPSEMMQYGQLARSAGANADAMATQLSSSLMGLVGYFGARINSIFPTTFSSGGETVGWSVKDWEVPVATANLVPSVGGV